MKRQITAAILTVLATTTAQSSTIFSNGFEAGVGINCGTLDTDGDRLPNCYENEIGTSYLDPDTDGDDITDGEEVIDLAFNPTTNNFRFNPLISDVPKLEFELASLPDIRVRYDTSETSGVEVSVERTSESASSVSTSTTASVSVGVEYTTTVGAEVGTTGAKASTEASASVSAQAGFSWSQEQTAENRQAYSRGTAETQQQGVTNTGGLLRVAVNAKNGGHQSVRVDSLTLRAGETFPTLPGYYRPIGNMNFDGNDPFPISLGPNQSLNQLIYVKDDLLLDDTLDLLGNSRNLVIEPATWQLVNEDTNVSFANSLTAIAAKTATVIIDYGPERTYEKHYVATVGDFNNQEVSLSEALRDILRIPVVASPSQGITAVRNVGTDASNNKRWVALYTTDDGVDVRSQLYNPAANGGYNIEQIPLRAGYVVHLINIEDADGDGVGVREEFVNGSSDLLFDTDGDGLDDGEEITIGWVAYDDQGNPFEVFSNPTDSDVDRDGYSDFEERANQTDPNTPDHNPSDPTRLKGDFNADGLRDTIIAAPGRSVAGQANSGTIYMVQSFATNSSHEPILVPQEVNDGFAAGSNWDYGHAIASGFINGDAYADLVVGVPEQGSGSGGVRVIYGSPEGLADGEVLLIDQADLNEDESNDRLGYAVVVGDFDGNGFDDIAAAAPWEDLPGVPYDAGVVHVIYSDSEGIDLATHVTFAQTASDPQFDTGGGSENDNRYGETLTVGDFNGDGYADLVIGVPSEDIGSDAGAGMVSIVYGSSSGLSAIGSTDLFQDPMSCCASESGERFGHAFAVGDFNRDGADDLLISTEQERHSSFQGSGAVHLFLGSTYGIENHSDSDMDWFANCNGCTAWRFGGALAAGDYNKDGLLDFVVGGPNTTDLGDHHIDSEGRIFVYYQLPSDDGLVFNDSPASFKLRDFDAGSQDHSPRFATSLATVDVNHDGVDDLLAGAPRKDVNGEIDAGAVYFILGKQDEPLLNLPNRHFRLDEGFRPEGFESGALFGARVQ